MADINTLDQGAKILQNVDVGSIVTGLALGIADAQERLDNNSVSQLIRLSETKVAGKSLLEFGFQPAFYAFEYADVSASIQLKMAIKEEVEVDFSLAVDYQNNTTFDKEFFNRLEKNKSKSLSKSSKTQKDFSLLAKASKKISINESSFNVHEEEGSISKIETAEEKIRDESKEIRVESIIDDETLLTQTTNTNNIFIRKQDGYVIIVEPEVNARAIALLKMEQNYTSSAEAINLNAKTTPGPDTFDKIDDFEQTLENAITGNDDANSGTTEKVIGINNLGIHRKVNANIAITPYVFYFDWDKYKLIDFTYSQGVENNSLILEDVKLVAKALKNDPNLNITITGYTDGSGNSSDANNIYNEKLGENRAKSLMKEIENHAGKDLSSQITIITKGEQLAQGSSSKDATIRKVTVEFDANSLFDYIYFDGGNISTGASVPTNPNIPNDSFVMKKALSTQTTKPNITFTYGGNTVVFIDGSSTDLSETSLTQSQHYLNDFYIEKHNDVYYLLHEEAYVNYFIHSKESKEMDVEIDNVASADMNKDTTKVYVGETQNDLSKLKQNSKDFEGDRSLAISGSLDVRYARQFGVSVEGNASVSARMISVPPPTGLENYIASLTGNTTSGS